MRKLLEKKVLNIPFTLELLSIFWKFNLYFIYIPHYTWFLDMTIHRVSVAIHFGIFWWRSFLFEIQTNVYFFIFFLPVFLSLHFSIEESETVPLVNRYYFPPTQCPLSEFLKTSLINWQHIRNNKIEINFKHLSVHEFSALDCEKALQAHNVNQMIPHASYCKNDRHTNNWMI